MPHISAPDAETLAYRYAQDNVRMTANQLVTVRGESSQQFGGAKPGMVAGYDRYLADQAGKPLAARNGQRWV